MAHAAETGQTGMGAVPQGAAAKQRAGDGPPGMVGSLDEAHQMSGVAPAAGMPEASMPAAGAGFAMGGMGDFQAPSDMAPFDMFQPLDDAASSGPGAGQSSTGPDPALAGMAATSSPLSGGTGPLMQASAAQAFGALAADLAGMPGDSMDAGAASPAAPEAGDGQGIRLSGRWSLSIMNGPDR